MTLPRPLDTSQLNLAEAPGLNMAKVRAMYAYPHVFPSMCEIQREDETSGFMQPTPAQRLLFEFATTNRWTLVNKYRQAKMTTSSVLFLLLRDCMYLGGVKGLLIAERHDTAVDIFERINFAYHRLPDDLRMPLAPGRKAGAQQILFPHGGGIKILTAGGRAPAIGRSIDRLVITEFGEAQWQKQAAINIFPTINKRPNAKVILESTPGRAGSHHEAMWKMALEGKGRFAPLFLKWWLDATCRVPVTPDFRRSLDPTEEALLQVPGMTLEALAFRRMGLETEFAGDPRLFSAKYPMSPLDGWLGGGDPIVPADLMEKLLSGSLPEPPLHEVGVHLLEPKRSDGVYLITADPAGYGTKGDPSALVVWDAVNWREVAYWQGREEPGSFAFRLERVQAYYNGALLAVESNAAACIATLRDRGVKNLYWTDRDHPGWYATDKRVQESNGRLIRHLNSREMTIRSKAVLHQLRSYDGQNTRRKVGDDGIRHHFDLVRCAIIAAHVFTKRRFEPVAEVPEVVERQPGQVRMSDLDRFRRRQQAQTTNPFEPPPRSWM